MKDVSIIGYGNFGKIIDLFLNKYFNIFIYDLKFNKNEFNQNKFSKLTECLSKEIIILSIPVQNMEKFLVDNKQFFNKQSIVIDVSSVKIKPVELMNKYLHSEIQILGTHPLFGPNSLKDVNKEHKIVLSPVRINITNYNKIKLFLKNKLKLKIIEKTPEEHDKEMAIVQGLTHFISKTLNEMHIQNSEMKTLSFNHLYTMKEILKNDTTELFETIQNENPYSNEIREKFVSKIIEINNSLKN